MDWGGEGGQREEELKEASFIGILISRNLLIILKKKLLLPHPQTHSWGGGERRKLY